MSIDVSVPVPIAPSQSIRDNTENNQGLDLKKGLIRCGAVEFVVMSPQLVEEKEYGISLCLKLKVIVWT